MHKRWYCSDHFLFLLGCFLPFLVFLRVFPICSAYLFYSLALLFTISFLVLRHSKLKKKTIFMYLILLILMFASVGAYLPSGVNAIYNQITDMYQQTSSYVFERFTVTIPNEQLPSVLLRILLGLYLLIMLLEYQFIVCWKKHFAAFAISFLLYFPTMLYGTPQPWLFTLFLFVYWALLLYTSHARHKTQTPLYYGKVFSYLLLCFAIVFIAVFTLIPPDSYVLSEASNNARQKLLRTIDQMAYNFKYGSQETGEVDLNRAGNRIYTGAVQMEVTHSDPQRLYLKTYSGAIYNGHSWESLPAEQYRGHDEIDWTSIRTWMNQAGSQDSGFQNDQVSIKDMRTDQQYAILPYYLNSVSHEMNIYYDGYAQWRDHNEKTIHYRLWKNDDVLFPLPEGKSYQAYERFIREHYLQIPDELIANIQRQGDLQDPEMLAQFQAMNTEEIISYVRNYIYAQSTYTLNPSTPPRDEDFVSYFLWQNRRGYCVYYASAATMLLRYYGIPARYVEGFRVDKQQFNTNGVASVKDSDAHAWVEIFDEAYGWVPLEMTPAADDTDSPNVPESPLNSDENNSNISANEQGEPTLPEEQETSRGQHLMEDPSPNTMVSSAAASIVWKALLLSLLPITLIVQAYLRFRMRDKKIQRMGNRQAVCARYGWLEDIVPYGAIIPDEIIKLAEKARFSQHEIEPEERRQIEAVFHEQRKSVLSQLSLRKKLRFYLWNAR